MSAGEVWPTFATGGGRHLLRRGGEEPRFCLGAGERWQRDGIRHCYSNKEVKSLTVDNVFYKKPAIIRWIPRCLVPAPSLPPPIVICFWGAAAAQAKKGEERQGGRRRRVNGRVPPPPLPFSPKPPPPFACIARPQKHRGFCGIRRLVNIAARFVPPYFLSYGKPWKSSAAVERPFTHSLRP